MVKPYPKVIAIEIGHLSATTLSGGDKLLLDLMPHLNYEISVIIPTIAKSHWKQFSKKTITISSRPYLLRIIYAVLALYKHNPNIIISSTNYFTDVLPAFIFKLLKPDVVWLARVLHLTSPSNHISYFVQQVCIFIIEHFSDRALALNPKILKLLSHKKKSLLTAGINYKQIVDTRVSKNIPKFDCIFVGRLHKSKGINDLPHILKYLPGTSVGVIGEGQSSWYHPQVSFLGRVNDRLKYKLLKSSKVFLCLDHEAGWGLAVAEAMAAGIPVVAYDLDIFGSVFKQGFLKSTLKDYASVAKNVNRLLTEKGLYKHLSRKAILQSKKLSLSTPVQQLTMVFNEYSPKSQV